MTERKDTSLSISKQLAEKLDNALTYEHNRGNTFLRSRSNLAEFILTRILKEEYPV